MTEQDVKREVIGSRTLTIPEATHIIAEAVRRGMRGEQLDRYQATCQELIVNMDDGNLFRHYLEGVNDTLATLPEVPKGITPAAATMTTAALEDLGWIRHHAAAILKLVHREDLVPLLPTFTAHTVKDPDDRPGRVREIIELLYTVIVRGTPPPAED